MWYIIHVAHSIYKDTIEIYTEQML
jgi:hypothetical protein